MDRKTLITGLLAGILAGHAFAEVSVYTNRQDWEAAAGSELVAENFEGLPLAPLNMGINNLGNVRIDMLEPGLAGPADVGINAIIRLTEASTNQWRGQFRGADFGTDGVVPNLIFTRPVTAFGADWNDTIPGAVMNGKMVAYSGDGDTEIDGGTVVFSDYLAAPGDGFLGIVSSVPISRISLSGGIGTFGPTWNFRADNLTSSPAYSCGVNLQDLSLLTDEMRATFDLKAFEPVGWTISFIVHSVGYGAPVTVPVYAGPLDSGSQVIETTFPTDDLNVVGLLSVLSTADGGIVCADLQQINLTSVD